MSEYDSLALNTSLLHASVYSGMDFNSFAVSGDVVYAAGDSGIYILDSDKDGDAEINTGIVLPTTILGTLASKRVRVCFTDCQGSQPTIRLVASSSFTDPVSADAVVARSKAFFPRTVRGKNFDIVIANFDSIIKMEFFLTILTR